MQIGAISKLGRRICAAGRSLFSRGAKGRFYFYACQTGARGIYLGRPIESWAIYYRKLGILVNKLQKARDLVRCGSFVEGLKLYATLAAQFPQVTGEYGSAAAHSGDFALADQIWEKFHRAESKNSKALCWLALEYGNLGLDTKSRALFTEAAHLEPGNLGVQTNLAVLLARTSSVEEARPVVNSCLALDPRSEQPRYLSAHLDRREQKFAEAEQQLRDLLADDLKLPQVRYACHAELAHVLDRAGRCEEAMDQLEAGKRQARESFDRKGWNASFEQHEKEMRRMKLLPRDILQSWSKTFPPDVRNAVPPVAFLCGSARSGTTLFEKILDAHPAVAACDESHAFRRIQPRIDLDAPVIPAQRLNVLREMYVRNMAMTLGAPTSGKTLLDKNPSQTAWLPAFLRMFPDLRVLIALRDPRDVILSLYFQNQPNTNCLTFEQHARVYVSVMEAWLAVREWEGLWWMETRYEDLVADLSKEGSRITKFLGLEWNEQQPKFYDYNREKAVGSNNYGNVTQPIYRRSVGRWRDYEKYFKPILPMLEPYCWMFGYETRVGRVGSAAASKK